MESKQKKKLLKILYILLILAGCVAACSDLIANDYVKVVVVMATICVGLFGIMQSLNSSPEDTSGNREQTDGKNRKIHENK